MTPNNINEEKIKTGADFYGVGGRGIGEKGRNFSQKGRKKKKEKKEHIIFFIVYKKS